MATVKRFEDLEMWKEARALAKRIFEVYKSSAAFLKDYKLWDQINAASGSIMDNIAEGFNRGSRNEFVNFLSFSSGSVGEVKSQLHRALDREYFSQEEFNQLYELTDKVGARVGSFIKYLNTTEVKGLKFKQRTPGRR